jgi:hypothetical protein
VPTEIGCGRREAGSVKRLGNPGERMVSSASDAGPPVSEVGGRAALRRR